MPQTVLKIQERRCIGFRLYSTEVIALLHTATIYWYLRLTAFFPVSRSFIIFLPSPKGFCCSTLGNMNFPSFFASVQNQYTTYV